MSETIFEHVRKCSRLREDQAPADFEPQRYPQPTKAWPGSEDKISVLCERAERGEPLHVPGDASFFRLLRTRPLLEMLVPSEIRIKDEDEPGWPPY